MEGFRVPVHRSLCSPILIGGVPREFAILNGTLFAVLLLGVKTLVSIPLFITIQTIAVLLAKKDPYFLQTFTIHLKQKHFYEG